MLAMAAAATVHGTAPLDLMFPPWRDHMSFIHPPPYRSSTPPPYLPHVGGRDRCYTSRSAPLVCAGWVARLSWTPEKLPLIRLDRVSKDYTEGTKTRAVLREASATVA